MDVSGVAPNIPHALREAHKRGIRTATVAGAASLPSTRSADVVISALERPSIQTGVLIINVIIYVLVEVLRWTFAERFAGAEQAIAELTAQLQTDPD